MKVAAKAWKKLNGRKWASTALVLCAMIATWLTATRTPAHAQTFQVLHSFNGTDGKTPFGGILQIKNGDLLGTTFGGGANGLGGTVFKIAADGTLTTLYSFCSDRVVHCLDGAGPYTRMIQAVNGAVYGTTALGGTNAGPGFFGAGTIFKINPNETVTSLFSFGNGNGLVPNSLIQAPNGHLYGSTFGGGLGFGMVYGFGDGKLNKLFQFNGINGKNPNGGVIHASDGNFYGTTLEGGSHDGGIVFRVTPHRTFGTLTTLYNFCSVMSPGGICLDGRFPLGGPVQASDGNLYGVTNQGGAHAGGTVYRITLDGTLTTLYNFCSEKGCTDGAFPTADLVQATDGNLYGTTTQGGLNDVDSSGDGTVYKITFDGTLTTIHNFDGTDGKNPFSGVIQAANGSFYGTTVRGGADNHGTVFEITP